MVRCRGNPAWTKPGTLSSPLLSSRLLSGLIPRCALTSHLYCQESPPSSHSDQPSAQVWPSLQPHAPPLPTPPVSTDCQVQLEGPNGRCSAGGLPAGGIPGRIRLPAARCPNRGTRLRAAPVGESPMVEILAARSERSPDARSRGGSRLRAPGGRAGRALQEEWFSVLAPAPLFLYFFHTHLGSDTEWSSLYTVPSCTLRTAAPWIEYRVKLPLHSSVTRSQGRYRTFKLKKDKQ